MNLIQMKAIDQLKYELTKLLQHCNTRDDIVFHFSHHLLAVHTQHYIEDYDFYPELTDIETSVRVHVHFIWDLGARHEFVVKKSDSPTAAYNRAMGII